ncbi:MAG: hypothetical protein ACLFP4_08270 [Spirochaetales bacterium]
MGRRIGGIYALFAVVVFLTLLVVFVSRLNTARTQNIAEAHAGFDRLVEQFGRNTTDIDQLAALAERHFDSRGSVLVITLYSPDSGLFFARSRGEPILALGAQDIASFTGFPEYQLSEIKHILLRRQITARTQTPIYADVVYSVLGETDVYPPLRDTLITLLAFAFVTVLVAVLINARTAVSRERASDSSPRQASFQGQQDAPQSTSPSVAPAPETHSAPEPERFEEVNVEEIEADDAEPGTLFNPATGLSFRSHLDRKLGLELERAAYNDQDLSCILIEFDGIRSADDYVERAKNILDAFQFEDLCFEFGPKSYFAILPNTELPQAIRQATEFKKRYRATALGLSARNGRLVEASRVIKEAEGSLAHAQKSESRIVGFRPDPRKYRQFVSEQLGSDE